MFDIVVWGATGFTGKLIAEYLTTNYPSLKVAIAGRSQAKLEQVSSKTPIIIANSSDKDSLDAMVSQTKVIISSVGPFAKYGALLIESCVRNSVDYVDITGEPHFVLEMYEKHNKDAEDKGIYIVPSCGFDSIPSDLATFLLSKKLGKKGLALDTVQGTVFEHHGNSLSGGSISAAFTALEQQGNPYMKKVGDFNAKFQRKKRSLIFYNKEIGKWQVINVMQGANMFVVGRSNKLLNYSSSLQYYEHLSTESLGKAILTTLGFVFLGVLILIPPIRWAMSLQYPPGSGATMENMLKATMKLKYVGYTKDEQFETVSITFKHDAGYLETAKMVAESAICLVLARKKCGNGQKIKGGVLTPASCMGDVLVERLIKAGINLE